MVELKRRRAQAIAEREGEACFVTLVREYAAMGYTAHAVAHRLLGTTTGTMLGYLEAFGADVTFKKAGEEGWTNWNDPNEYSHKWVATRIKNGKCRIIEHDGLRLTIAEWARRTGLRRETIHYRISRYGWSIEEALTTPAWGRKGALRKK